VKPDHFIDPILVMLSLYAVGSFPPHLCQLPARYC
jgi:hypothetical protein